VEERKEVMSDKEIYKWFIAHVAYRNAGNVKSLLEIAGLEYYMPFKDIVRTWNGVEKELQVPVTPSCVFVRVEQSDFVMLQMMKELSLLLDSEGSFISLSENQMNEICLKLEKSNNPGNIILDLINKLS